MVSALIQKQGMILRMEPLLVVESHCFRKIKETEFGRPIFFKGLDPLTVIGSF
jgi:hypothetical protein